MTESTISQKIRKLLTLADGNQNEHERDAAMRLAMELLSKHNLDLEAIADESRDVDVHEVEVFLKLEPWIRSVLHAACKLYYTRYFMRPVYRGYFHDRKELHPTFVGTRENISVTLDVATWLLNSIRNESNCLFTEPYERRSFRLGAAHKLYQRACKLIEEESTNSVHSSKNGLMLVRNTLEKANAAHVAKIGLKKFNGRAAYCDGDAYGMGESFANSVNLGRTVVKPKAITAQG